MEFSRALLSEFSIGKQDPTSTAACNKHKNAAFNDDKDLALGTISVAKSESKIVTYADELLIAKIPPLSSDLENNGVTMLLKEDQVKDVFREYPYLFAQAGDLTAEKSTDRPKSCSKEVSHIEETKFVSDLPQDEAV
ncbi:hypothetical protein RIF29_16831 [Crotalaria pallida]|uniref:Uncharacterized protein n=1 Tax=Crotalaria pallida TaxID=3830 RepID=A0AAN9IET7_CROPI